MKFDGNPASLTGRYLSDELRIPMPRHKANRHWTECQAHRRAGPQSEETNRLNSAGHVGVHHRSFRLGKIDPGARCPIQSTGRAKKGRPLAGRRRKWTASLGRTGSTTLCWSISRRSAARRARIRSPTSRPSTPSASCSLPLPESKKRGFAAGHFLLQHSRRPLRNLPGRRHRHRRDAVPGRRRADLRGMQGHALQAGSARNPLSAARTSTRC